VVVFIASVVVILVLVTVPDQYGNYNTAKARLKHYDPGIRKSGMIKLIKATLGGIMTILLIVSCVIVVLLLS